MTDAAILNAEYFNAMKRKSTVDQLFTESSRRVRGAKSLTGIHLGAAGPNAGNAE